MTLIPISQVLKSLSPDEQNAIKASSGKMIKHIETEALYDSVNSIVAEAIALKGHGKNLTEDEVAFLVANFTAELFRCFTTFTIEQVREAVRLGALGKLSSETIHVSVENLCRWVNLWNDTIKRQAVAKQLKEQERMEQEMSEERKKEGAEQFKVDLFEEFEYFKTHGKLSDQEEYYHSAMYQFIEKKNGPLRGEIKDQLYQKAVHDIESEKPKEYIPQIQIHDIYRKMLDEKRMRARKYALEYVFNYFVQSNFNITDLWKED